MAPFINPSGWVIGRFILAVCWLMVLVFPACSGHSNSDRQAMQTSVAEEPRRKAFVSSPRPEPARWLRFDDFRPVGDGRTDDAPTLIAALKACQQQAAGLLINPNQTYFLGTDIEHRFSGILAIKSAQNDKPAVFLMPDSRLFPIRFTAETGPLSTSPTGIIKAGNMSVTLPSTTGLQPGDLLQIQSDEAWPIETGTQKGEHNIVSRISGNEVYLKYPCQYTYATSEKVSIMHARPATFNLKNLEFRVQDTGDNPTAALAITHMQHSLMENVLIRDSQYACSQWYGCYDTEIRNCRFENANQQGQGYGIVTVGGLYYNVHDNTSEGCRKLCDFSGDEHFGTTRLSQALNNTAYGEGKTSQGQDLFKVQSFCIATHGGADDILIQGNTAFNCQTAFQLRGINITLDSNRILGRCITTITLSGGHNHTITRNEYRSLLDEMSPIERATLDYSRYPRSVVSFSRALLPGGKLVVQDNRFDFARNFGIYGEDVQQQCVIRNNQFVFYSSGNGDTEPALLLFENQGKPLRNFVMRNNTGEYKGPLPGHIRYQTVLSGNSTSLLEWLSCEVQGLRASDLLLFESKDSPAIVQEKAVRLAVDKAGTEVTVRGRLRFSFDFATQATLTGLPPVRSGNDLLFPYEIDKQGEKLMGRLIGPTGQVILGAQAGTLGSSFAGGVPFDAIFNFSYHTN